MNLTFIYLVAASLIKRFHYCQNLKKLVLHPSTSMTDKLKIKHSKVNKDSSEESLNYIP